MSDQSDISSAKAKNRPRKPSPPRNPFAQFQRKKVDTRLVKIESALEDLASNQREFSFITELAAELASRLSSAQDGACSMSTLLRNKAYREKLVAFMAKSKARLAPQNAGAGQEQIASLTHRLRAAELEASNLRAQAKRVTARCSGLEKKLANQSDRPQKPQALSTSSICKNPAGESTKELEMSLLALHLIMQNFEGLALADPVSETIVDLSKRSDNVIVPKEIAKSYMAWLKKGGGDSSS